MKMLRHVMLGLGIAAVGLAGCAERPGKKKDDDKKADADKAKANAKARAERAKARAAANKD